ncbi:hypothetical protein HDU93_008612 [Gonapodya sp. JEL0774]|nr:hypothetical protein HDU93_008612 [Gonapodya sp. JEL0774]
MVAGRQEEKKHQELSTVRDIRPVIATKVVAKDDMELRQMRERYEDLQKQHAALERENGTLKLSIQAERNLTSELKRKNQSLEGELIWLKRVKVDKTEDSPVSTIGNLGNGKEGSADDGGTFDVGPRAITNDFIREKLESVRIPSENSTTWALESESS